MNSRIAANIVAYLVIGANHLSAAPTTTAFTYQGQLKDAGVPADGDFDMRFSLFDVAAGGATVAGPLIFDGNGGNPAPITVTNGLFQVVLDFGSTFDGTALWLNIQVRPHAVGNYATLSPRQPLTATPFALYALDGPGVTGAWNTSGSHIYNNNAGRVGIGTSSPQRVLHTMGDAVLFERDTNEAAVLLKNTANGVIDAEFGLHSTNLDDGYVYLSDQTAANTLFIRDQNVGVNTSNPTFDFQVNSLAPGTGTQPPTKLGLRWSAAALPTPVDWAYLAVGGSAPFGGVHLVREAGLDLKFSTEPTFDAGPSATQMTLTGGGSLGIGTTTPANRLSVVGSVNITAKLGVGLSTPLVPVHVGGGSDTSPAGGGYVVTGDVAGANISIDNNEIMARNNGAVAPLHLNANGGDIVCGGSVDVGYQIVTVVNGHATCPAGKMVIGGGCHISGDAEVQASYPVNNGWACVAGDQSGFIVLTGYAICVNLK